MAGTLRYRCAACGRDLTSVAPAVPCPCGHTLRMRIDERPEQYALPGRDALRYDRFKDWKIKYLQLLFNMARLRGSYGRRHDDAAELVHTVDLTLAACCDLGEWLTAGAEPRSITPADVARLTNADPLRVCRAVFTGDGTYSARLVPVHLHGAGVEGRVWVEVRRPGVATTRFDALDLAERCLVAWNGLLSAHGVQLPTWHAGSADAAVIGQRSASTETGDSTQSAT